MENRVMKAVYSDAWYILIDLMSLHLIYIHHLLCSNDVDLDEWFTWHDNYLDKRSLSFTSDIGALRQLITGHDVAGPIDDAVNLLEQLLTINPVYRCSAESALQSLFLRGADILCDYSKDYLHRPSIDDFDFEQEK